MKTINQSNYEEWLFDYFEGNLNKQETVEMMNFIQKDPVLQEEFNTWEKTYIREALPSKLKIETALLREEPVTSYKKHVAFAALALLIGGIFYYTINSKDVTISPKAIVAKKQKLNEEDISTSISNNKEVASSKSSIKSALTNQENSKQDTTPTIAKLQEENIEQEGFVVATAMPDKEENASLASFNKPDSVVTQISSTTTTTDQKASTKVNRKTQRRIEKYKRKARERREAEKFIKGKTPYVIPLDPQAF